MSGLSIKRLDESQSEQWNDYLESHAEATFCHLAEWRQVIEHAFGHACYFLYAETDGEICGVLPLAHIRSRLFSNALISTPFCVYGGAVADSGEIAAKLEDRAAELAQELQVDYLELRNATRRREGWLHKELYVTFSKQIQADDESNLKAIPRKQRAMVRKGIKAGLQSQFDDDVERFFSTYSTSVRDLGTPVFSRAYFQLLKEIFAERCAILTVTNDGEAIASVMSFYFKDQVLPYYGGGTPQARALKGFDFMYWELMRRSVEAGVKVFDYGRSKLGTGAYQFKKNWGFEAQPLNYQYHLVNAKSIPDINPLNPKYRMFVEMWKHLPLPIANSLGPILSRSLG